MEKSNKSLYTVIEEVATQMQSHGEYDPKKELMPEKERDVNKAQLKQLKLLAKNKIQDWAKDGRLADHRYLESILFLWKRLGGKNNIDIFLQGMLKDDNGLISFVEKFLNESHSHGMGDYVSKTNRYIKIKDVKEFIDPIKIEPKIRKIFKSSKYSKLKENEKLAIKIFLDTFDGKIKDRFK